jgi:hypothetical protein
MENIILEFKTENLEIKLSSEKLFINTSISNETFALRSINGVGVVDLVEDYNKALTLWKKKKTGNTFLYFMGGLFAILGLLSFSWSSTFAFFLLGVSMIYFFIGYQNMNKNIEPKLLSAVRIIMGSGSRDFQFNKSDSKSRNIAEFVAKVESTLTAYYKN